MTVRLFGRVPLQKEIKIEAELRKIPNPPEEGKIYGEIGSGGQCTIHLKARQGKIVVSKRSKQDDPGRIAPTEEIMREEFGIMKAIYFDAKGRIPKPIELYEDQEYDDLESILELIEYPTVKRLVEQGGLNESEKASLLIECANAIIEAAHENKVVHRDIKEDNFMIGEKVRLIDFGTSRIIGRPDRSASLHSFGRIGTVEYRAPEITTLGDSSFKSDIYAFGIMMYFMLKGAVPFKGIKYDEILRWHREIKPQKIDTPAWPVVERCLEKDPSKRPENMRSVRDGIGEEFEKAKIKIPEFCK
jgi:serine/threonine protein kinase